MQTIINRLREPEQDHKSFRANPLFREHRSAAKDQLNDARHLAGNLATQQLLNSGVIRAKLRMSRPGDAREQEADRLAETVLQMPAGSPTPAIQSHGSAESGHLQPKCSCNEKTGGDGECDCGGQINPKRRTLNAGNGPSSTVSSALQSSGQPLDSATRAFFEPRFGHDFSGVRVHTDNQAVLAARSIQARAFTAGDDLVFDAGEYAPGTSEGQRLLAHELAHVAQQRADPTPSIQRQMPGEPIQLPPEHPVRLNRLEEMARELQTQRELRKQAQGDLGSLEVTPNDEEEARRIAEERKTAKERLKNIEEQMIGTLESRISLFDEAINALDALVPGKQTSPESADVTAEIGRLESQREQDKRELRAVKRSWARAELEAINERLNIVGPLLPEEQKALEDRRKELGNYLSETAERRLAPGANGKAANGRCYVVYQNEVRVGGSLNWRFNNPGSIGPPPSAKGLPAGAIGIVASGAACGGRVGLYIFSDPASGRALTMTWVDDAAAKDRFAGEFLLNYSHEGQKYLDCVSKKCPAVNLGTEANGGRGDNLKTLQTRNPAAITCIKSAIFFCESGSAVAGDIHTCGDSGTPTEFREMLGCDE